MSVLIEFRLVRVPTNTERWLEVFAVALTLIGVWLIGGMDVRGQYAMAGAQVLWCATGYFRRMRWLFVQSIILLALTMKAILLWKAVAP